MQKTLSAPEFLEEKNSRAVLDVRSPGEFRQGHIPGATSFPLFSDEERAEVGTIYKQKGKEKAFERGLEIVGPKMSGFVREAQKASPEKKLGVHCWRGGQRSRSMAWLLQTAGFDVVLLEGGYKNYRNHVLQQFQISNFKFQIIGGRTGTGKTKILREIGRLGEQIIDLEALAHHKGSAFGHIGELEQPTVEQFENDLFQAISKLDPGKRIWLENESRSIGRVFIPGGFWANMKRSALLNIEIPFESRLQNLLDDYAKFPISELENAFQKIDKKLGGLNLKTAIEALREGDLKKAAEVALWYYDKTYQHCLDNNPSPDIRNMKFEVGDSASIASEIMFSQKQKG